MKQTMQTIKAQLKKCIIPAKFNYITIGLAAEDEVGAGAGLTLDSHGAFHLYVQGNVGGGAGVNVGAGHADGSVDGYTVFVTGSVASLYSQASWAVTANGFVPPDPEVGDTFNFTFGANAAAGIQEQEPFLGLSNRQLGRLFCANH